MVVIFAISIFLILLLVVVGNRMSDKQLKTTKGCLAWFLSILISGSIARIFVVRAFNWVSSSFTGAPAIGLPALAIALILILALFIALTVAIRLLISKVTKL